MEPSYFQIIHTVHLKKKKKGKIHWASTKWQAPLKMYVTTLHSRK